MLDVLGWLSASAVCAAGLWWLFVRGDASQPRSLRSWVVVIFVLGTAGAGVATAGVAMARVVSSASVLVEFERRLQSAADWTTGRIDAHVGDFWEGLLLLLVFFALPVLAFVLLWVDRLHDGHAER